MNWSNARCAAFARHLENNKLTGRLPEFLQIYPPNMIGSVNLKYACSSGTCHHALRWLWVEFNPTDTCVATGSTTFGAPCHNGVIHPHEAMDFALPVVCDAHYHSSCNERLCKTLILCCNRHSESFVLLFGALSPWMQRH
jgi:hypothetical protein